MRLKIRLALVATLFVSVFVVCYSVLLLLEVPERADAETGGALPWVVNLLPRSSEVSGLSDEARLAQLTALVQGLDKIRHVRVALYLPGGRLVESTPSTPRVVPGWLLSRLPSASRAPVRKDVFTGDRLLAYFEVSPAVNDELAELWDDYLRSMTLVVGLSLVAIALIVWSTFRLLAPLDRVDDALRALAAGRQGARLPLFRSPEMDNIATSFNRMADALAAAQEERQALLRKLVEGDENTRRSVAHDLHDELSPYLVALQPLVRTLELHCKSRPELIELAPIVQTMIAHQSQVLGRLKSILKGLHPPELATWGLRRAIEHTLGQSMANAHGETIEVNFTTGGDWHSFGPTLDVSVFRLIQECLTNVQRHSGARGVDVTFDPDLHDGERRMLGIEVVNDRGEVTPAPGLAGLGILGMRDRCIALGGSFESGPIDGDRWRTRMRLPLDEDSAARDPA